MRFNVKVAVFAVAAGFVLAVAILVAVLGSRETRPEVDGDSAAWIKAKRDKPGGPLRLVRLTTSQTWQVYNPPRGSLTASWSNLSLKVDREANGDELGKAAVETAREPNVVCAAVIDLFSDDTPRVLRWYYDDGNGVRKLQKAPSSAVADSMRDYLASIVLAPKF